MKIEKLFSFVLSPQAIALYVTIIFSLFSPIGLGPIDAFTSIFIGSLFLTIIPLVSLFYFHKKKGIDLDDPKRKERIEMYLIGLVSYLVSSSIFWILNCHVMFVISMAYLFVGSAISLINLFWKISAHSAGIVGPITGLVYIFGLNLIPLYVLVLPIFWIRIKFKAHDILQLISGSIVAIFITSLVYTIMW
jgi:hypothetical protein